MGISSAARRACVLGAAAIAVVAGCSFPKHQFLPVAEFNRLKDGGSTGGTAGAAGSVAGGSGGVAGGSGGVAGGSGGGVSGGAGGADAGGTGGTTGGSGGVSGSGGTGGATGGSGGVSGAAGTAGAGGSDGGAGTAGTGGASGGAGGSDAGVCTGPVVINEVATDGTSGSDEYVELYNAGDCTVDLDGWRLDYTSSSGSTKTNWTGTSSDSLPAKGYFVLAGGGFAGTANYKWGSGFGLAKSGGGVALYNGVSTSPVDSMAWENVPSSHIDIEGTACANIPSLASASRIPDGHDTNDNSADFVVPAQRTPGKPNVK